MPRDRSASILAGRLGVALSASLGLLGLACSGSANPVDSGQLRINEVMAANSNSCADEAGERDDWVELHNGSDQDIDLEGFSITDDSASPRKQVFDPGLVIPGGGVLLLWADGTPDQGANHLTFKLKASGEGVMLYDPDEQLVDEFHFVDAASDVSYARLPDGTGDFVMCASPTCGARNGSTCAQ